MPLTLQAKLLRVLEDGIVTPVGSSAGKAVDVRILAATNVDLHAKIAGGGFRQDLYFRLARFTVPTPPLRERREDVALLAGHFLNLFATEMGIKAPRLGGEALAALEAYHFPGNVRELKNIIERSLIESGGGEIQPQHLHLMPAAALDERAPESVKQNKTAAAADLPLNLEEAEALLIQRALARANGNIAEAARLLGVHRTRIYRKIAQGGKLSPRLFQVFHTVHLEQFFACERIWGAIRNCCCLLTAYNIPFFVARRQLMRGAAFLR